MGLFFYSLFSCMGVIYVIHLDSYDVRKSNNTGVKHETRQT
jgi:hypothetical protein